MDDFNLRRFLQSDTYYQKRAQLHYEINSRKLIIDRLAFRKSVEEKVKLANAKAKYKNSLCQ